MYVEDLIRLVPSNSPEQVEAARKKWERPIKEAIKAESGFKLKWSGRGTSDAVHRPDGQVSISTSEVGKPLPPEFIHHPIPPEYELAAVLQVWLTKIRSAKQSTVDMLDLLQVLETDLKNAGIETDSADNAFTTGKGFTRLLEQHSDPEKFDLVKYVLRASPNVLGCFWYRPDIDSYTPRNHSYHIKHKQSTYRTNIELYWGVIALSATALNLSIEGLTAKVLAHELGHAYTYLGYDRDGTRWTGYDFENLSIELKEGLAQYYAYRVGLSLENKFPELLKTYNDLLPKQPPSYRTHLPWLQDDSPEALGVALAKLRRFGNITLKEFESGLMNEKTR
ncbi:MAG: hypothetical protein U9P07_09950 [Pseudomonadota bacterium]|nr:hypothetical protein [Pseudomonadota bacterium]